MTSPHPRPLPVLVLGLFLVASAGALAQSAARWDFVGESMCSLGQVVRDLSGCGQKKVERVAGKTCAAIQKAALCSGGEEGREFFKTAVKAAKRCRKAQRTAERKGIDASGIRPALETVRISIRSLLLEAIDEVKDRPDFVDDDRLVRAAAKAEDHIQKARLSMTSKKPFIQAFSNYRTAFEALRKVL